MVVSPLSHRENENEKWHHDICILHGEVHLQRFDTEAAVCQHERKASVQPHINSSGTLEMTVISNRRP